MDTGRVWPAPALLLFLPGTVRLLPRVVRLAVLCPSGKIFSKCLRRREYKAGTYGRVTRANVHTPLFVSALARYTCGWVGLRCWCCCLSCLCAGSPWGCN